MVSQIVDQFGRPLKRQTLEQNQTEDARIAWMQSTYANHPSRGLTPRKLASILQAAEQGDLVAQCELFEDMEEKDGHIFAELGKRKRALIGFDWTLEPPPLASANEKKAVEQLTELLESLPNFSAMILDMADGISKGYACLEYTWHQVEKYYLPASIEHRDPSWFTVNKENRNKLLLRTQDGKGEALQPFGWITHLHKAKSGYVTRAGLGRVLSWPYLFKNYSVRDLAEFLEIYGLPMRLGKYPSGATDKDKATLLRAVVGIGHNAAGIIPSGMEMDFMESAKGQSDPFVAMMDWCERTQSKAILGGTLTSQADGKSSTNALGNVHNEVREDLRDADLIQIGETLTRDLVYPIAALNIPGITSLMRCPRLVFNTQEPEDLKTYSEALPPLVEIGLQIPRGWAQEKLGIPVPEQGEEVLATKTELTNKPPAEQVTQTEQLTAALTAALARKPSEPYADQLAINSLLDGLKTSAEPQKQMEQLLAPVLTMINEGADLLDIESRIEQLLPNMAEEKLQELLARILFVSELHGRVSG